MIVVAMDFNLGVEEELVQVLVPSHRFLSLCSVMDCINTELSSSLTTSSLQGNSQGATKNMGLQTKIFT
jgi:hypothetical protein